MVCWLPFKPPVLMVFLDLFPASLLSHLFTQNLAAINIGLICSSFSDHVYIPGHGGSMAVYVSSRVITGSNPAHDLGGEFGVLAFFHIPGHPLHCYQN